MCLNWDMPAEAAFLEHFPGGQTGVSAGKEGIILHFGLHLRLTCWAGLTVMCSCAKTPV